jgi:hypothetical protein
MALRILFAAIGILPLLYILYQRFFSRLATIPGPAGASWSKWWLIKTTRKGDFHRQIVRLHATYGPLVRTGPNEVSVADPAAIKKIYGMLHSTVKTFG